MNLKAVRSAKDTFVPRNKVRNSRGLEVPVLRVFLKSLAFAGVLALLASCHKQVAMIHPPAAPQPEAAKAAPPVTPSQLASVRVVDNQQRARPNEATKATIQSLIDRIQDVYFDYDKDSLRPDAESTLREDAKTLREILKDHPTYKLTVEGFCDDRGLKGLAFRPRSSAL